MPTWVPKNKVTKRCTTVRGAMGELKTTPFLPFEYNEKFHVMVFSKRIQYPWT